MIPIIEPSYIEHPNEWISWYRDTHRCSLVDAIDAITRKRDPAVKCCVECHMAHFGMHNEYTWRCGETDEVLTDITKLPKNCPIY